jgi:hypothetical protein
MQPTLRLSTWLSRAIFRTEQAIIANVLFLAIIEMLTAALEQAQRSASRCHCSETVRITRPKRSNTLYDSALRSFNLSNLLDK